MGVQADALLRDAQAFSAMGESGGLLLRTAFSPGRRCRRIPVTTSSRPPWKFTQGLAVCVNSSLGAIKERTQGDELMQYKDALEQLYNGSPSLAPPSASPISSKKPRKRKDLLTRVNLKKRKLEKVRTANRVSASNSDTDMESLWSKEADELLTEYTPGLQNWLRLERVLLTAEEEHRLASLLKPYKALEKLRRKLKERLGREPSEEEWASAAKLELPTLRRHMAVYEAARNKLIQHNARLVLHQARKYLRERSSLTLLELCQEGVKGLITAVEKFEPKKGYRFSTYATFWIRNSILRAQTKSGYPVRAPYNFSEARMHIKNVRSELEAERNGAPVSDEEVIQRAGIRKEKYMEVMRTGRLRIRSLHDRDRITGRELVENLPDWRNDQPATPVADTMLRLGIDDVLDSLNPKESLVIRQRFGLDGKGERASGEISRSLRMSREMVRRYEARGLLKLKHPVRLNFLRSLLSDCHQY